MSGFEPGAAGRFEPLLLRRVLADAEPAAVWPAGIRVRNALPGDEAAIHAVLVRAFAGNRETVPAYEAWREAMIEDEEFAWDCWFLAEAAEGGGQSHAAAAAPGQPELVGAALCWTSAFVKDLAVDPDHRRRGIGEALLRHAIAVFAGRGAPVLSLKVDPENPTGAVRLYRRLGFVEPRQPRTGALPSPA